MRQALLLGAALPALVDPAPRAAPARTVSPGFPRGSLRPGQRVRVTLHPLASGRVRRGRTLTGQLTAAGGDSLVILTDRPYVPVVLRRRDVRRLSVSTGIRTRTEAALRNAAVPGLVGTWIGSALGSNVPGVGASGGGAGFAVGTALGVVIAALRPAPEGWRRAGFPAASPEAGRPGESGVALPEPPRT